MTDEATEAGGWRALKQSGRLPRLLVLCAGVWLHAADSLLVATLMPDAARELQGVAFMGWTIALYIVGSIVAGAAAGMIAARFGVRRSMAGAALFFALGCAVSGFAPNMELVLIGRLMQGLGGGAMLALTFVGIEGLFPSRLMGPVMAVISAVWGASAFCGPLIGGVFAHFGLWRWGFGAFAIQAVILAAVTLWLLPAGEKRPPRPLATPFARLALLGVAIVAIAAAGNVGELPAAVASIAAGLVLLGLFFRADRASANPLLPRGVVDPRGMTGAGLVFVMTFATATISFSVYGPLLLQFRFGVSPLVGGYVVAVESVAWTLAAVAVAQAPEQREHLVIRAGAVIATLGVAGMIWALPDGSFWVICVSAAALGGGFGAFWAFVTRRVVDGAPEDEKERASAALPTCQLIGYATGAALAGVFANAAGLTETPDAAAVEAAAFWIYAGFLPVLAAGWLVVPRLTRPA
jgi:MFS family permease